MLCSVTFYTSCASVVPRRGRPGSRRTGSVEERGASPAACKKAYRRLALRLHPDKCQAPHAEEAFKRVSAAYAALQDGRNVRFGGDGASSEATYNYGAYADEAELFRAMFAGDGSLLTRLVQVFRANPWTLLALVSALQ